ncbi:hypothetical protein HRI_000811900 [Hibiscus trionum]|uniref:DUF3741 domain-containing protein n=1 Tax=Hibiscus trionum TaxID=183268 RepID=A0A9W7H788_HIBTR|nr:hypothetical protein HRI_000811900 [Hibiscus trionum]
MSNTKRSSSGCFSSVLRRILCSGTPQTHPSDHVAGLKLSTIDEVAMVQVPASETGPGIVARLMGLDTLPENNNWLHKGKVPGAVTRSRSVNFMDYMLEFDLTQAKHRRVKTSSSFREVPVPQGPQLFQHNQKQEFLVVYLDNEVKNNEAAGFKARKSEKGDGSGTKQAKQKNNGKEKVSCKKRIQEKNKKISELKNEPRGVSGKHSKEVQVAMVTRKKKKNQRPVKKIEFSEDSRSLEMKTKKKCSSKSVKHLHDSPTTDINARIPVAEPTDMEETEYYVELIDKLSKLTEEDIKFANWETKQVFTFEEICAEFGEQILEIMLHQVADELCKMANW